MIVCIVLLGILDAIFIVYRKEEEKNYQVGFGIHLVKSQLVLLFLKHFPKSN